MGPAITEKKLMELIDLAIKASEKLGDQHGGSGHLQHISYLVTEIKTKQLQKDKLEVWFCYNLYVETEFTYLPENPPIEYIKTGTIILDKE